MPQRLAGRVLTSLLVLSAGAVAARAASLASTTTLGPPAPSRATPLVAYRPHAWAPPVTASAAWAGLRVAIDPVDGTLSMPAAVASDFVRMGDDPAPIRIDHFANGMVTATLDDRFMEYAVASFGAQGKPQWDCVHGAAAAQHEVVHPAGTTPAPRPVTDRKSVV